MTMPIDIDGSVDDDAHTILLGVEEEEQFTPDFKEYIRKEQLNWWRFDGIPDYYFGPTFGWVFWSQLGKSSLSFSLAFFFLLLFLGAQPLFSFTDNFADSISHALQKLISKTKLDHSLVQFWAPTKTSEGRTLLTTQFQPFALGTTSAFFTDIRKRLCSYRMGMCREYNNSFYADAECAQELLGLPGRVFLHQLPESTPKVELYTLEEYPQLDLALRCGIQSSMAVPVFEHSSHTCVGVLEIVSLRFFNTVWLGKSIIGQMYDIFQEFGLLCFDGCKHEMQIGDENKARTTAIQELKTVLKTVCEIHELPLAKTWVPCSACNGFVHGQLLAEAVELSWIQKYWLDSFGKVIKWSHLGKGGVAGMVLSSPNMLYCSDIAQLSLAEYPLVHYARLLEFRGWFTLCVQSSYTANDIYVLEFFLPTSNRWGDNSQTSLSLILGTMEENFRTFKLASGQEPGDLLSVEVMDFQNGLKLHSVEKIQAKGRGVMLQPGHLDQPPMDAISNETNVVSEAQKYNLPSLEPLQSGKVTTQLDSSDQLSMDHSKNAHNVDVTAERNIIMVTSSDSEGGPRETQERQHKNTGVRIEVSLDDILKYSKKSRNDAAKKLQASDSVAHTKPAFQDADIVTIKAKYENNTIKFQLSLPSRLVALQQEVAKRLNLEAGTYYIRSRKPDSFAIEMKSGNNNFSSSTCTKSAGEATRVSILELRRFNAKNEFKLEGETNGDDSMSFTLRVVQPCCEALNFHFPFYLAWDTPKSIASELVEHFDFQMKI
ncbi:hypothetical protein RHGRI_006075 [Rhododendron griersonianum]|uniref:NLP1-9 GAF domain-containing protein n=1 Tax=Rhododendron griersonianum TaxID=479676 RepID=A0AAV6LHT2_9ERIC|nr:hypothetical protein RHGRI_006075 [Rhododendron griersonianum]